MSRVAPAELAAAEAAIGRTETVVQNLDTASLERFSIAIGGAVDVRARMPVLAHWAWFLPRPTDADLGADGHPMRGGFLPGFVDLPRRMFAATRIAFHEPLLLDAEAWATTRIVSVKHKPGRSGDLVFVEVERLLTQQGRPRLTEVQTLVYREAGDAAPQPLPVPTVAAPGDMLWRPSTVNLFRFSAATFNGHRIHYDAAYARGVEGYPALIVHGPFIAARLAEFAAQDGALASFEFRASSPSFVDQPIRLVKSAPGEFMAERCDGVPATTAKATYK